MKCKGILSNIKEHSVKPAKKHWDEIFSKTPTEKLGWFEPDWSILREAYSPLWTKFEPFL